MKLFKAKVEDVPRMMKCARLCCEEHGAEVVGGHLDAEHYQHTWENMIAGGTGVMFLYEDNGKVVGGIGGAKYPALLSGKMRASQLFIYILPEYRGAMLSVRRLMKSLEIWAVENGCSDVVMPLLETMPRRTQSVYVRFGYKLMEMLYRKPLEVAA
jgi:GNAT superfamily N-acetyltransferase